MDQTASGGLQFKSLQRALAGSNPEDEKVVVAYSPLLIGRSSSRPAFFLPVRLVGIHTATQRRVTNMERDIVEGSLDDVSRGDSLVLKQGPQKRLGARRTAL